MHDFTVKSSVHDYNIKFVENVYDVLKNRIIDGDVIIIDNKVKSLYPDLLMAVRNKVNVIGIDAHEEQKSYQGLAPIIEELILSGFRKNHRLIGIGGGITQDITAFTASIMYRGVQWLFFPTTLLAQGDSCIGSKTSINFGAYKNQLGGFYPPNKIFIYLGFLETLSIADLQSGLGEMAHYFIVDGRESFLEYRLGYEKVFADKSVLTKLISNSLKIKKGYIEIDEYDQSERQVFNYGHSFGHAIESLTNYSVPHGIAVSIGMDMANYISFKRGYLAETIRLEIRAVLKNIWVGYDIRNIDVAEFLLALSKDKKNVGSELRLILCRGYGKVFKTAQSIDGEFTSWIEEYFRNELD